MISAFIHERSKTKPTCSWRIWYARKSCSRWWMIVNSALLVWDSLDFASGFWDFSLDGNYSHFYSIALNVPKIFHLYPETFSLWVIYYRSLFLMTRLTTRLSFIMFNFVFRSVLNLSVVLVIEIGTIITPQF